MSQRTAVAKIVLFNEKGLVLSLQRSATHPTQAHQVDLPGGLVDPGESEHAASVRELKEEAGIEIDPNSCTLLYTDTRFYEQHDNSVSRLLYFAKLDHTPEVVLSHEHESYEWITIEDLISREKPEGFYRKALAYAVEHNLFTS